MMMIVSPNFHGHDVLGRHQIRGSAKGPTQQSAKTIKEVLKYHGGFSDKSLLAVWRCKNSPQCLHFIA
jgi:ABC-type ATPase with predicted acetyltransferase domain